MYTRCMEQPPAAEQTAGERTLYDFFNVVVFIKGAQGIFEIAAGVLVALIPLRAIVGLVDRFTEDELLNDPDDFIASHLHDFAHNISIGGKEFAAIYLLAHGAIKLGLALGLLSGKRWVYPVALGVLGVLIAYQAYRIWLHHSLLLTAASLFDCAVFYIVAREFIAVCSHDARRAV